MDWRRLGGLLGLGLGVGLCLVVVPEAEGGGRRRQATELEAVQAHPASRKLRQAGELMDQRRFKETLYLVDEAQAEFEVAGLTVGVGMAQLLRGIVLSHSRNFRMAVVELESAILALCGVQDLEYGCAWAHAERGVVAFMLSESSAMTHLNEALRLYVQLKDPLGEAGARLVIGDVLLQQGSPEEAHAAYGQALALVQTMHEPLGEASARLGIGDALLHQGFTEKALAAYEQALSLYQTVWDPLGVANARLRIGVVLDLQGSIKEARTAYEQALALFQAVQDPLGEAHARLRMGGVLLSQGSPEKSRTAYEQALALYQTAQSPSGEANARLGIGDVLLSQGFSEDARAAFEQALVLYQAVQDSKGEADARLRIGKVLLYQGFVEEARVAYDQALDLYQAMQDPWGEVNALLEIGKVLHYQGSLEEARTLYERVLAPYQTMQQPSGEADARLGIGDVLYYQGSLDEARTAYEQALTLYKAVQAPKGEADARLGIGNVLLRQGSLEEARTAYEQALTLYKAVQAPKGEASARLRIGDVLLRQGSLEEARSAYEQALDLYKDIVGDPTVRLNALSGLARSQGVEDAASKTRAWEHAQSAFALLRDEVQPQIGGQTALRRHSEANSSHLTDLIILGIELDHPEEALNAHLLSQGRGLIWSRALALRAQEGSVSPAVRGLVEQYESIQDSVGLSLSTLVAQGDSEALTALRVARREQETLEDQLGSYLGLTPQHFAPPTTAELQAALRQDPSDPVLAVYLERGGQLLVFVLDGETLTVRRILGEGVNGPERSALVQATDDLVESLHRPGLATNTADQRSALSGFPLAQAHTLYNALVAPWAEALDCDPGPCRPLLIMPDGLTHWVPFAALPTALPSAPNPDDVIQDILSAPYLGQSVPITLLPSPALLLPRFQSSHPQAGAAVMGSPANANFIAAEQQEVAGVWAQLQGKACARQGAACPEAPLTGKQASELSLQTWLPLVRYLHVSSHGVAGWVNISDLGYPYIEPISRLVLAEAPMHTDRSANTSDAKGVAVKGLAFKTGPEAGLPLGTPDGYLYKEEAQRFGSMPEMIVLSSCSSALGESNRTEGFAGVTYGLLAAGSSGVISAAWPVSVEATRDQMLALYDAHFEDGQDWATALMSSRNALAGELEGMPLEHPYFWAGFNLYGYVPPQP